MTWRTLAKRTLDELLGTNLKGVLFCLKHGLPRLLAQGGGVVVNAGSFIGTTLPFPRAVVYGATKAAVLSVTRSVAAGLTPQNIGVFAVCPWITDTPMIDRLAGHNSAAKAQFGQMNPSGRIVAPDDVAEAVLSIFAGQSGLVSGDAVLVDSGGALQTIAPMSARSHAHDATSRSVVVDRPAPHGCQHPTLRRAPPRRESAARAPTPVRAEGHAQLGHALRPRSARKNRRWRSRSVRRTIRKAFLRFKRSTSCASPPHPSWCAEQ